MLYKLASRIETKDESLQLWIQGTPGSVQIKAFDGEVLIPLLVNFELISEHPEPDSSFAKICFFKRLLDNQN